MSKAVELRRCGGSPKRAKRLSFAAAMSVLGFGFLAGSFADIDTAFVPFVVNADATVSAVPKGETVEPVVINVEAGETGILKLPVVTSSVRMQSRLNNAPSVSSARGKVSLNLPASSYKNADVALYAINGRTVMRAKATASEAVKSVSRSNVGTGVYLLSVKGTNGSFSNRITHRGGALNIKIAFNGVGALKNTAGKEINAGLGDVFEYDIHVSANGYLNSAYQLNVVIGDNEKQEITLRELPTVTFDPQGGNVNSTSAKTGANGKLASLPEPTKDKYVFDGWFTAETGGEAVDENTVFSENTTVYARWINSFTDTRDGKTQTYGIVKIGGQIWMAENLNFETESGSYCYDDNTANCDIYGRLYTWSAAMDIDETYNTTEWGESDVKHQGACPVGWHLPSNQEWDELINFVGGWFTAGEKLKSQTGWNWNPFDDISGNGTDDYGFSALPGGFRFSDGSFNDVGGNGFWWSATEGDADNARDRYMHYLNSNVIENYDYKSYGSSVRCVKNQN